MDSIVLNQSTQLIRVEVPTETVVVVSPDTGNVTVEVGTPSTSVISAGPPGPPGALGSFDLVPVLEEVDTRIATHNQAAPIHTNATSGRDFAAFFQNGLI